MQVVFEMHKGLHPRRPTDPLVADSHWNFIQQCWSAENRLSMAGVLDYVESTHRALVETSRPDLIPTVAPSHIVDVPFNPSNDEVSCRRRPSSSSSTPCLTLIPIPSPYLCTHLVHQHLSIKIDLQQLCHQ
jgi:hypothetical protein